MKSLTYVSDVLRSVQLYRVQNILQNRHIDIQNVLIEEYENHGEVDFWAE